MQINAYNNLLTSLSNGSAAAGRVDKGDTTRTANKAADLSQGFGAIMEKALVEPDGGTAVEQAKKAMADGTLEQSQAFETAAENLLTMGI